MEASKFLADFEAVMAKTEPPAFTPELVPVSMIDVDRSPPMDMDLPMSDNCPVCGGNNMLVGDYVCWGTCSSCYWELCKEYDGL